MGRDKYKEEKEFEELISVNGELEMLKIKKEISSILPKNIKIISKNESQKN